MDYDEFLHLLRVGEPKRFVELLIETLRQVYAFNADRHEEDMGDDAQTFGFLVYRNGWRRLEDQLGSLAGVSTRRPNNSLQIQVEGGVHFHVYRGGNDETFDIYTYDFSTGTQTKVSLPAHNGRQLSLFEQEEPAADHVWRLDELVFVHAGNPDTGLTGVWVGAPIPEAADGSQWAWVLPLYSGESDGARAKDDTTAPVSPFDALDEPDLDVGLLDDEADQGEEAG
ncbi:MAG: hypothetical protein WD271_14430 [Acidimicrobiia bacterium]